jgi:RNA polymerase sigma-70 factor (ECF subfamily)
MSRRIAGSDTTTGFDSFYRREYPTMVALAGALSGRRDLAVELAQEAMLRAFRDWPKVSSLDRPGAWVRRVTINLATDAHRRQAVERRNLERVASPDAQTEGYGVDDRFWVLVRDLPERQRAVMALRFVDDLSLEEIAAVLEISLGTVKSRLFAARASLATSLSLGGVSE